MFSISAHVLWKIKFKCYKSVNGDWVCQSLTFCLLCSTKNKRLYRVWNNMKVSLNEWRWHMIFLSSVILKILSKGRKWRGENPYISLRCHFRGSQDRITIQRLTWKMLLDTYKAWDDSNLFKILTNKESMVGAGCARACMIDAFIHLLSPVCHVQPSQCGFTARHCHHWGETCRVNSMLMNLEYTVFLKCFINVLLT